MKVLVKKGIRERGKLPKKSISRITKKNLIDRIRLTNVVETETRLPLTGFKGCMQIRFKFSKKSKSVHRTARSNQLFYPRQNKTGFNQCIQRAMAQNIPFSPDEISIVRLTYVYWIPIKR